MGLLAKSALLTLIISLFFVLVVATVSGQEQPKPESTWINKELNSKIVWQETLEDNNFYYGPTNKANCTDLTYFRRNLAILPFYDDKVTTNCAMRLGTKGYIDGDYLIVGRGLAGRHNSIGRYYKPVIGSDALLIKQGNHVRLVDNLTNVAEPSFNYVTGRLTYAIPYNADQIVTDSSGRRISWASGRVTATTTNGYIVINQSNGPLVRVSKKTGEKLAFGSGTFYKAGGNTRKPKFIELTGGGRYALVGENKGNAYLYDLDTCSGSIAAQSINDAQYYYSEACDFVEINNYLSDTFNDGKSVWIENIEFDRTSQINAVFGYRDVLGVNHVVTVKIVPSDIGFQDKLSYVALGDSFASGEGDLDASWYELGTDVPENKCHLSMRSYPYLLADILSIEDSHSVACSGAVIENITNSIQKNDIDPNFPPNNNLGEWYPGIALQDEYLLGDPPTVSTISISGNDAGFAGKLIECAAGPGTCKYAEEGKHREYVAKEIAALKPRLIETYEKIYESTDNKTKLLAMSYPKFIQGSGGSCGLNVHLNESERVFIDKAVELINEVIRSAVLEVGAEFVNIENALANYNLCSYAPDDLMAVNGLTKGNDVGFAIGNESYHPNQNGHHLIAQSFLSQTGFTPETYGSCGDETGPCDPTPTPISLADVNYWGSDAANYINMLNDNPRQKLPRRPQTLAMTAGASVFNGVKKAIKDTAEVAIDGLKPSSWVDFVLNSEPINLGSYQADENGQLIATITIPNEATSGVHTLNAYGEDSFGNEVHYYEHVAIGGNAGACGLIPESGIDQDGDDIDDACDPIYIAQTEEANSAGAQDKAQESSNISATGVSSEEEQANTESEAVVWAGEWVNESTQIVLNNDTGEVLSSGDASSQQQAGVFSSDDKSDNFDAVVIGVLVLGGVIILIISTRFALKD